MYTYRAKLLRVVDGDTVDAMIDLGFDVWVKRRIRLADINAHESRTRDKEEKEKGIAAKNRLINVLQQNDNEFNLVSKGIGKFGRCLGIINIFKSFIKSKKYHGKCINEMLIKEGHAVRYED